jgi:hypothetical protein
LKRLDSPLPQLKIARFGRAPMTRKTEIPLRVLRCGRTYCGHNLATYPPHATYYKSIIEQGAVTGVLGQIRSSLSLAGRWQCRTQRDFAATQFWHLEKLFGSG